MKKTLLLASVAMIAASCTNAGPNQDDRNNPRNDRNYDRNYNNNNNGCCTDPNNGSYNNGNYNNNPNANYNNAPNNNGSMDRMQDADMQTTARVRNMLQNDSNIGGKGLYVNAETSNGIVTITGDVPSREASQYVERKVRSVKGVRGVDNQLNVTQG